MYLCAHRAGWEGGGASASCRMAKGWTRGGSTRCHRGPGAVGKRRMRRGSGCCCCCCCCCCCRCAPLALTDGTPTPQQDRYGRCRPHSADCADDPRSHSSWRGAGSHGPLLLGLLPLLLLLLLLLLTAAARPGPQRHRLPVVSGRRQRAEAPVGCGAKWVVADMGGVRRGGSYRAAADMARISALPSVVIRSRKANSASESSSRSLRCAEAAVDMASSMMLRRCCMQSPE